MGLFGSTLSMTVEHALSPAEVIRRLKTELEQRLQKAYPNWGIGNLDQNWSGNEGSFSCTAGGHEISGTMSLDDSRLTVEIELPAFAGLAIDVDGLRRDITGQLANLLR